MPYLPVHLSKPFAGITERIRIAGAKALDRYFAARGYLSTAVRDKRQVPPLYVLTVPPDLAALPVNRRERLFIRILLPNVALVNRDILKVRAELEALARRKAGGAALGGIDRAWLAGVAADYGLDKDADAEALLRRVDIVPAALTLAQAIDESGWGTSALARVANALFGEHGPSPVTDAYVTAVDDGVEVARFVDIYHAVAGYVHTLNTADAYAGLRQRRAADREVGRTITGYDLAEGLLHYSARGRAYVGILRELIRGFRLGFYDGVRLDVETPAVLIEVGADRD
jgi:uncharacterized FlgJ-related protein